MPLQRNKISQIIRLRLDSEIVEAVNAAAESDDRTQGAMFRLIIKRGMASLMAEGVIQVSADGSNQ